MRILLVDDHPAMRYGVRYLLDAAEGLEVVGEGATGAEAVRLARELRPDLVLLDLNMPRKDGREVLREMKQDERLRSIPVLVLTTSGAQEDIAEAYASGANAYIRKPVHFDDFITTMRAVEAFWMSAATLPVADVSVSRRSSG